MEWREVVIWHTAANTERISRHLSAGTDKGELPCS
jgi:hypothetical protein